MNRKLPAEALGTCTLVRAGTGAIVVNRISGGAITHAGIALTFGLLVLAMIHTLCDVSGARLNPAVTTAFAAAGRFPWREAPGCVGAQIAGGSTGAEENDIAIGSVSGLKAMFAGPVCGASMNPARSLAPAIVSGHLSHLWIYLAAPTLDALLAIPLCIGTRGSGCCSR